MMPNQKTALYVVRTDSDQTYPYITLDNVTVDIWRTVSVTRQLEHNITINSVR